MHLKQASLLSKEWGEPQVSQKPIIQIIFVFTRQRDCISAQAIGKGISFLAVTEVPSSLKWNYEMLK